MDMTVQELIDFLKNFHPNKMVFINSGQHTGWHDYWTVCDVMAYDGNPILCALERGK